MATIMVYRGLPLGKKGEPVFGADFVQVLGKGETQPVLSAMADNVYRNLFHVFLHSASGTVRVSASGYGSAEFYMSNFGGYTALLY